MMLRYFWIVASALVLALPASATDRMTVVATFTVITDMLANVGGGHIEIKSIVGVNGDCELYQPTAADVATVAVCSCRIPQ
jgi:zinc/manganese transport system substrate-binding protein